MRLKTLKNVRGISESIGVSFAELRTEYAKLYTSCDPAELSVAIAPSTSKNPKHEKILEFCNGYLEKKQTELDTHIVAMNNKDYELWNQFLMLKHGN